MKELTVNYLCEKFKVKREVIEYINQIEASIKEGFLDLDEIREYNQFKVITSMQENKLSSSDFHWTTGYGYGDIGRDKVESIYAQVFKAESALVRPSIASGTHALSLTLSGILRPGDHLLYISGEPYDTLLKVIGTKDKEAGSLLEYGISYDYIPLKENQIDLHASLLGIKENTKLIAIQRSTGYSDRRALTIDEIEASIKKIKENHPNILIMVDNCYGEFLENREPIEVGADLVAGSLIKNPGGGIALSGGYIAGKEYLIDKIANRLTAPGLGRDTGLTFGTTRTTLQGLFLAPHIVMEAVKGAILFANVYHKLGFNVVPKIDDKRSDIIQGIELGSPQRISEFCKGIQAASAVDSYVTPEAWDMPGYSDKVIMAAGGFIEGSSIELSADGPLREPYYAYYQGGLTYDQCKLGAIMSLNNLYVNDLVKLR